MKLLHLGANDLAKRETEADLGCTVVQCDGHGLRLNPTESSQLVADVLSSIRNLFSFAIAFGTKVLSKQPSIRYLSVTLDSGLRVAMHCRVALRFLGVVYCIFLVTFCQSILNYCHIDPQLS